MSRSPDSEPLLTPDDQRALAARGIPAAEALRQLRQLAAPLTYARLARPCSLGDGIVALSAERLRALANRHAEAAAAGRIRTFVPASGAATRMFKDLLTALAAPGDWTPAETRAAVASGRADAAALLALIEGLPRFAFRDALAATLAPCGTLLEELVARGPWRTIAEALLRESGLDYARFPKGLLAFHRYPHEVRTAFEEHLVEAATLARDAHALARLHFTVSPEHRERFVATLAGARERFESRLGVRFDVEFSEQHPATDTIAAEPSGAAFRDESGALLFRPAGHGALLRNLGALAGDLVFIKNIDNVTVDRLREPTQDWAAALLGLAAELGSQAHALRARLDAPDDAGAIAAAQAFVRDALGAGELPAERAALAAALERPLRVCGMVRNTGEPGGGPFWVREESGALSCQVVESAEVDPHSSTQQATFRAATHFNPVFLACSLRDHRGRPYHLEKFVDAERGIVARKSAGGRELLALERPGLWNGAMARWNSVFVEVPLAVFQPVKTLFDLLRPEHQA